MDVTQVLLYTASWFRFALISLRFRSGFAPISLRFVCFVLYTSFFLTHVVCFVLFPNKLICILVRYLHANIGLTLLPFLQFVCLFYTRFSSPHVVCFCLLFKCAYWHIQLNGIGE